MELLDEADKSETFLSKLPLLTAIIYMGVTQMVATQQKTLADLLNMHVVKPFQDYTGPIPETVPAIRLDGREWASGNIVFAQRLGALESEDRERIEAWGQNTFNLPDLLTTFEDSIKLQPNSGFLTGIRGVVDAEDGLYVAIGASYVQSAVSQDGMKYFEVKGPVTVSYIRKGEGQEETVTDVVLLPYNRDSVSFTPDQFRAINAPEAKRANIIHGRDMEQEEIVEDGKAIHFAWASYNPDVVVPLVPKIFEFNKEAYGRDRNMGLELPFNEPSGKGKGRALIASRLWSGSMLYGCEVGGVDILLLGVVKKDAEGVAQKLEPWQNDALNAIRNGDTVLYSPRGTYVRAAGNVQLSK